MDAINTAAVASQKKIEVLARETQDLQTQYNKLQNNTEYLQAYNAELQRMQAEQEHQVTSLQQQLAELKHQRSKVLLALKDIIQNLETALDNDPPFHLDQRKSTLINLKQQLAQDEDSLVSIYRELWDFNETELAFSRSIEAYQDTINLQGSPQLVNMLRIGRFALYYQTQDGNRSGAWNATSKQWEALPATANADIKQGLLIANKQLSPQPFTLPINRRSSHE